MNTILPIFSTDGSIGDSILTASDDENISFDGSISVLAIAKTYNLGKVYIRDRSFVNFISLYKGAEKLKISLCFGVKFDIVNNATSKEEISLNTLSSVCVWMKNSAGYQDLIKLYSEIHAKEEYFYYNGRGDWSILKKFWTNNLILTIPFYSGFLAKNSMRYDSNIVPDFGENIKPIFEITSAGLPQDEMLNNFTMQYCAANKYETITVHPIYYYSYDCFKAFTVMKCVHNRSTFNKPQVDFLASDRFCMERFCEMTNQAFIHPDSETK